MTNETAAPVTFQPGRSRRVSIWLPLVVALGLLAAEAVWQMNRHRRHEPLIRISLPNPPAQRRYGATEVGIDFAPFSRPATLKVTLIRVRGGRPQEETDVTEHFIARANGAVGNLAGLIAGEYVLRARVFGQPENRVEILVEEDARISFRVPPPPPLDLA